VLGSHVPKLPKKAGIDTAILISPTGTVAESIHVIHGVLLNHNFFRRRDKHVNAYIDAYFPSQFLRNVDHVNQNTVIRLWHFTAKIHSLHGVRLMKSRGEVDCCTASFEGVNIVRGRETAVLI
jgi:hypothetical protein